MQLCVCVCLVPAYATLWGLITLTNSSVLAVRPRPCSHARGWGLMGSSDTTHCSSKADTSSSLTHHHKQTGIHTRASASTPNSHTCTNGATVKWGNVMSNKSNKVKHLRFLACQIEYQTLIFWHITEETSQDSEKFEGFWCVLGSYYYINFI